MGDVREPAPGWVWEEVFVVETFGTSGSRFRTTTEVEVPCTCVGGWVEDENWSEPQRDRAPHDGLIPCGFCNHGGWDAPWPAAE